MLSQNQYRIFRSLYQIQKLQTDILQLYLKKTNGIETAEIKYWITYKRIQESGYGSVGARFARVGQLHGPLDRRKVCQRVIARYSGCLDDRVMSLLRIEAAGILSRIERNIVHVPCSRIGRGQLIRRRLRDERHQSAKVVTVLLKPLRHRVEKLGIRGLQRPRLGRRIVRVQAREIKAA